MRKWILWIAAGWLIATAVPVFVFRFVEPPTSAYMLEWKFGGFLHSHPRRIHQHWVSYGLLPDSLKLAVIASEDQRFRWHWGFDFDAIAQAWQYNESHRRLHGASTISQQVARNLFLWPGRDWIRKGLEAYFTVLLEALWPKHRILEVYLNIAEFAPGIYGAGTAAHDFFGVAPMQLTPRQCTLLAAVLPAPDRLHAFAPSTYVNERADEIEQQMRQLGNGYLAGL